MACWAACIARQRPGWGLRAAGDPNSPITPQEFGACRIENHARRALGKARESGEDSGRLAQVGKFVADIEQAQRAGYVPLAARATTRSRCAGRSPICASWA